MNNVFIGQIILFGGNFAPKGFMTCSGQILSIAQNQALFSILGTTYGGNGVTTFALPDLRGRVATSYGQGPGLTPVQLGQLYGTEKNTLNSMQLPMHNHTAPVTKVTVGVCSSDDADSPTPVDSYLRNFPGVDTYAATANGQMGNSSATVTVQATGGNQPVNNIQPTLTMTYCIAIQGIYPSRN